MLKSEIAVLRPLTSVFYNRPAKSWPTDEKDWISESTQLTKHWMGSHLTNRWARRMVLEIAILDVKPGQESSFERDFSVASGRITTVNGYKSHELHRCLEKPNRYILLVRWETLEAHTEGFRRSPQYLEWKKLLHHYYDPFPTVEHYTRV